VSVLESLRAYAAAHPTDVKVVVETIQMQAELEAYAAQAQLRRKWAQRNTPAPARRSVTQRGLQASVPVEVPFLLTRRVVKVCGVRVPAPRDPSASWPGW
jgi:hypothetical protein